MTYEAIREARLQHPFKPFRLKMKDGSVHFIYDAVRLAIRPKILFFANERGEHVYSSPEEVDSLVFVEQTSQAGA